MSVNVHVAGVRDPDGMLGDMVALKMQCDKLAIDYPEQLREYFKGTDAICAADADTATRMATEVGLRFDLKVDGLCDGSVEMGDGMMIDLAKLPEDIKRLRIYMS